LLIRALYEAALISLVAGYKYVAHKSPGDEHVTLLESLTIVHSGGLSEFDTLLVRAVAVAEGVSTARDLVNAPINHLTPTQLAAEAERMGSETNGLTVSTLGPEDLRKERFGALIAVAQGSHQEPRLITMEWSPEGAERTVVLVGKWCYVRQRRYHYQAERRYG